MQFKLKALVAAVALTVAGGANASVTNANSATGGSLIFQAWDGSQAFIMDLGTTFNSVYGSAASVIAQAAGDTSYSLGSLFTSTFGSNSALNWSVLSDKSVNDGTSKAGMAITSLSNGGYGSFNTTSGTSLASNTNTSYANINANVPGVSGLVSSTNAAYTPSNFASSQYNALSAAVGGAAITGFFSGAIDAATAYGSGTGIGYFTSVINTVGTSQTTKTAFTGANGSANWILKNDGTLTYHVASATPAAVPLPAAFWLFGSGLLGLVGIGRRKLNATA